MNVLFITSAIVPIAPDVKLLNIEERLYQTLFAIEKIKNLHFFDQIYLCDGSGYDVGNIDGLKSMSFMQPKEQVTKYGKSFGELLIYEYFFSNTNFNDDTRIYKISARWIIENLDEILNHQFKYRNLFYTFYPYGFLRNYVHTSFFVSEMGRLKKIVAQSKKEIFSNSSIVLETAFYNSLLDYKKKWVQSVYPRYNCICGTSNKNIMENCVLYEVKNTMTKLGMYAFSVK